jgi:hypothetical protein
VKLCLRPFNSVCHERGVILAKDNTSGPVIYLTFLALEIDIINMLLWFNRYCLLHGLNFKTAGFICTFEAHGGELFQYDKQVQHEQRKISATICS